MRRSRHLILGPLLGLVVMVVAACGGSAIPLSEVEGLPSAQPDGTQQLDPSGAAPEAPQPAGDGPAQPGAKKGDDADGYLVPEGLSIDITGPEAALPDLTGSANPPAPLSSTLPAPAKSVEVKVPANGRLYGADISWPQCPKGMGIPQKRSEGMPMPTSVSKFVILGLTNGPSFHANPCLQAQFLWAVKHHLLVSAYAVVSYPHGDDLTAYGNTGPYDGKTRIGALRNVGYQAAVFNVGTMKRIGLRTPIVWIDVEPVPSFDWTGDTKANAAVVEGTAKAYRDAGYRIGFYSTPALWQRVAGDLKFGEPEWRAAGQTSENEAIRRCAKDWSIQGGPAIFGQWVEDRRDRNVTCPGAVKDAGAWFTQY